MHSPSLPILERMTVRGLTRLVRRPSLLSRVLNERLPGENGAVGHAVGNLLLAALSTTEGDFTRAVRVLGGRGHEDPRTETKKWA